MSEQPESGAGQKRILLAEDDDSMRAFLERAIQRAGYDVIAVDRGTAALPHIAGGDFDLLLTDIVMPEMDGIELAQRAAALAPKMRVMFITGFAAVALAKNSGAPEGARVLSKPFHLRELTGEIERMLAA
ncbi:MAG: response regulator [Pacificimonas sp.]